jgi:LysM repeat protein
MPRRSWTACVLLFVLSLPLIASAQSEPLVHVVQRGENLYRISLQYGLSVPELAAANDIADTTRIFAGQQLVIPQGEAAVAGPSNVAVEVLAAVPANPPASPVTAETAQIHIIQPGETLREIAFSYGLTEAQVAADNGLSDPNRILYGQELLIRTEVAVPVAVSAPTTPADVAPAEEVAAAEAAAPVLAEADTRTHTVVAGEYLSLIAAQYNVTPAEITAANLLLDPNRLLVGQQLVIPSPYPVNIDAATSTTVTALPAVGTGREVVVDLSSSQVYAYENGLLKYRSTSSNGLPATPTVQGSFTVQRKVRTQTMSGPGYWLPNVEWVVYFYQGYALHGTYWHNNFGQPMSHGCVNLTNSDAQWFYDFVDIGTPITVQY